MMKLIQMAGPNLVVETAKALVKANSNLKLQRSITISSSGTRFLEWARDNNQKLEKFGKELLDLLIPCFSTNKKQIGKKVWRERLWSSFHSVRVSDAFQTLYKAMPTRADDPIFWQMMLSKVMEELYLPSEDTTPEATSRDIHQLTEEEQKVIRYMAGYVVVSLRRKLEHSSHPQMEELILCLWNLCEDSTSSDTFLAYTKSWIDKLDCGGLFPVNDMTYSLFEVIEIELRKYYSITQIKVLPSIKEITILIIESEMCNFTGACCQQSLKIRMPRNYCRK